MKKYLYIYLLLLFSYCKDNVSVDYITPKFIDMGCVQGEIIAKDLLLVNPQDLFISDSTLMVFDKDGSSLIHIYDKNGTYQKSIIERGKGTGEVLTAGSADYNNGRILICDPSAKRMIEYDVNNERGDIKAYSTSNSPSWVSQAKWYNDNIMVKAYDDKMRYGIYNGDRVNPIFNTHPELVEDAEENRSIWEYCSQWKLKPDNTKMVATTYIGCIMEILSCNHKEINSQIVIPIHKPEYALAQGAIPRWVTASDDTIIGFEDISVTDNFIYSLMYGANINNIEKTFPTLCLFTWDGHPNKQYRFNERIYTFGIDRDDKTMYAIVIVDGDIRLMRYKLT